jgi:glycosyltransferase involved in cell wall biosynthesis
MMKIGLNMIVRDESKVIKRLLDSVAPFIDWYTIVDTGSEDNTKAIIKEVMDGHGIEGEIVDHEWFSFSDARNKAIQSMKGKADWGFIIDADEQLILDNLNKEELLSFLDGHNQADVTVNFGSTTYNRNAFLNVNYDWEWVGPCHSYLRLNDGVVSNAGVRQDIVIKVNTDGNSWGNSTVSELKTKYMTKALILEDYLKTDPSPRWVFYIANSYKDAFEYEKAIEWYEKRLLLGGYWEEKYMSQLYMVDCMLKLDDKNTSEILHKLSQCCKLDPNRAEHLYTMALIYQQLGNHQMSYAITKFITDKWEGNPFPKSSLFINDAVYSWGALDLHSVNCYKLGYQNEVMELLNSLQHRITNGVVPESEVERIEKNIEYFYNM